jgi:hypothetical protein
MANISQQKWGRGLAHSAAQKRSAISRTWSWLHSVQERLSTLRLPQDRWMVLVSGLTNVLQVEDETGQPSYTVNNAARHTAKPIVLAPLLETLTWHVKKEKNVNYLRHLWLAFASFGACGCFGRDIQHSLRIRALHPLQLCDSHCIKQNTSERSDNAPIQSTSRAPCYQSPAHRVGSLCSTWAVPWRRMVPCLG